ncbi:MAG TPA: hypothetical protein VHW03_10060 [Chthoniobacterales bacterium]|jgi:hypothetical protein|nr:hypothetical protein [Chthoniobacterales bacterium]
MNGNFAHLKEESPFHRIFPNGMAPIKNCMFPSQVRLEGSEETEAYMLAVDRCTLLQIDLIAAQIAARFNAEKKDVLASLNAGIEMPIRASQVSSVSIDTRAFL